MCNTAGNLFRLVIVTACAGAVACQYVVMFNCDFINFGGFDNASIGLWYYGIGGTCVTDQYEAIQDGLVAGARATIVISLICGCVALGMIVFEWLFCEICLAGCLEGLALCAAWVMAASSYMIYGLDVCTKGNITPNETIPGFPDVTDEVCEWGSGSTWNTIAIFLYMGAGALLCCAPQPKPICVK